MTGMDDDRGVNAVGDIPVAHTPPGGYGAEMPRPILAGSTDPLVPGAPDLRGTWSCVDVRTGEQLLPRESPIWSHVERVEQAGDRVVVTAGGIVHDMRADGSYDNGVHDVMASDYTTPIVVAASYEDGVLVLRPQGAPGVEVRRWREGPHMLWEYHTMFTARLERQAD